MGDTVRGHHRQRLGNTVVNGGMERTEKRGQEAKQQLLARLGEVTVISLLDSSPTPRRND